MSRVRQKESVAVQESRPKECPRLLTLPVQEGAKLIPEGMCPNNYKALKSKSGKQTCCKKKQLIPLREGTLRKHGYATDLPKAKRHTALKKAVKAEDWLKVFRKLNAVAIYNKNRPKLHKVFLADRDWVKSEYAK